MGYIVQTMSNAPNDFPINPYGPSSTSAGPAAQQGDISLSPGERRGMVSQVPILGVLMIVQGVMEVLVSIGIAFYAFAMPMVFEQMRRDAANNAGGGAQPPTLPPGAENWLMIGGSIFAVVILVIGVLTILSGVRIMNYRSRVLGITMLCCGMLTIATCYCFPTSLALAIYGLVVLLSSPVQHAFDLRSQGHEVTAIQRAFLSLS